MDPLTIAAASGLRSRMESLSLLANNLANATTSGFKTDREYYGVYSSADAEGPLGETSRLPVIENQWTDFAQGTLQPTANPLDLALSGHGFFAVNGPGGTLYTRNGSFQISTKGDLVTSEGFTVRGQDGSAIHLPPGGQIEVSATGVISQGSRAIGQLEIVDFKTSASLKKLSGSNLQNTDPKNLAVPAAAEVHQGKLEASNVAVSDSAMRLVGVMRQFEMLQKAISIGIDMNSKAIQEVARVNS